MSAFTTADTLHRLVKQALDSGEAVSIAEAEALLAGYRLALRLDDAQARDSHHQAVLLTAVALARRVFLGGVTVAAAGGLPLLTPLPFGRTLGEAVVALGATLASLPDGVPLVDVGGGALARQGNFHIRALFAGWRGGIVPAHVDASPAPGPVMALAPMLAAALAVNEAFLFLSAPTGAAGRRSVGLSLWDPSPTCDWLGTQADEPGLTLLPSRLWGYRPWTSRPGLSLGAWSSPHADPAKLKLVVLQDVDVITPSAESTSVLSNATLIGSKIVGYGSSPSRRDPATQSAPDGREISRFPDKELPHMPESSTAPSCRNTRVVAFRHVAFRRD
jgi:hypothetical protein